jgi:ketosteroid isomerase-like protein
MPSNRELVQRLYTDVWKGRNNDVLDEVCAPDCEFYDPLQGDRPTDLAAYKRTMSQFDRTFALEDVSLDRVVEAGDTCVFLWRMSARMKGSLGEVKPTGRTGRTSGIGLIQTRNGKIVEHRSAWDTLGFFQGLGLVPTLAAPREEEDVQPPATTE